MPTHRRPDRRAAGWLITLALVLGGGWWIAQWPATHAPQPVTAGPDELQGRFDGAVQLLRAQQFGEALAAFDRVIALAPDLPEAHVDRGFALLGLQQPGEARRAFEQAITLRPEQANAYYGLALAHEAEQDLAPALGAMRSYLHLARGEDERHLARARAAIWEWESQRPPPGPTIAR